MEACRHGVRQFVQQNPVDLIEHLRIEADEPAEPEQFTTSVLSANALLQEQVTPQTTVLKRHRMRPLLVAVETRRVKCAQSLCDERFSPFRKVTPRSTQIRWAHGPSPV